MGERVARPLMAGEGFLPYSAEYRNKRFRWRRGRLWRGLPVCAVLEALPLAAGKGGVGVPARAKPGPFPALARFPGMG